MKNHKYIYITNFFTTGPIDWLNFTLANAN